MERAAEAVTGRQFAPHFTPSVLPGSRLTSLFREVWELVAGGQRGSAGREAFLLLVSRLLERCGGCPGRRRRCGPRCRRCALTIWRPCDRRITLEQLSHPGGASGKYHLLRCFTRQRITPTAICKETVR